MPAPGGPDVAVIERGWHTDIGLPVARLSAPLASLAAGHDGAGYLVFGFGDRAFFMAPQERLGDMLEALFPGPSVILLTILKAQPEQAFGAENVVQLSLTPAGFAAVQDFIWRSLDKLPDGAPVRLGDGPYPGSIFFASGLTYDALRDCNYWTALALQEGGLPVEASGTLFAGQVMEEARRIARRQREAR